MKKRNARRMACLLLAALLLPVLFAPASASEADGFAIEGASDAAEGEELAKGAQGEAVEYTFFNEITCKIPARWSTDDDVQLEGLHAFYAEDSGESRRNVIMIRSEDILEILKVDAGNGALLTKEDVANYWAQYYDVTRSAWKTVNGMEYYDAEITYDERAGREIVIPIRQNEAVFVITLVCEGNVEDYEGDLEVILSSLRIPGMLSDDSQGDELTLGRFYENVKSVMNSSGADVSEIVQSDGYQLFSVTTEKYGQSLLAVTVDEDQVVRQIVIDPRAGAGGESQDAWSVFDELAKYITAVDATLDGYDAYIILADSDETHEENGFTYFFDVHDTGYFSIVQE